MMVMPSPTEPISSKPGTEQKELFGSAFSKEW